VYVHVCTCAHVCVYLNCASLVLYVHVRVFVFKLCFPCIVFFYVVVTSYVHAFVNQASPSRVQPTMDNCQDEQVFEQTQ
jgi:hypothetical protein